jgi:hypothetical protein
MSKFLLNLLLQISQALVNSKSNFYSKRILPPNSAHSAQPACPLPCLGLPACPSHPTLLGPNRPAHSASQPPGPRTPLAYFIEDVFLFGSCLPEPAASPRFSNNWAPAVSFVPHLQPPELTHAATDSRSPSAAPLRASGALGPLPPRLHFPSLNSPP